MCAKAYLIQFVYGVWEFSFGLECCRLWQVRNDNVILRGWSNSLRTLINQM